jgi:hypothetical protein
VKYSKDVINSHQIELDRSEVFRRGLGEGRIRRKKKKRRKRKRTEGKDERSKEWV